MNLSESHRIYFLGIGGIGMSALVRYFLWLGKEVTGYDRTCTQLTLQLEKEGAIINYDDNEKNIPSDVDLVIYTPAVPKDSIQLNYLLQSGLPMFKRAQVLGMIAENRPLIAVAGTHGKTTVTTILAHIFKSAGVEFMAFLGGVSTNYDSNFIHSDNPLWVIAEADEYDRSFLQLHPDIAVITSMDADHLDVYGTLGNLQESFRLFAGHIKPGGTLLAHKNITSWKQLNSTLKSYGLDGPADFYAKEIHVSEGKYSCIMHHEHNSSEILFGWAGRHNLENALAASAAAVSSGVKWDAVQTALESFKGVKRRFELVVQNERIVYIDDYAHHPEEIRTCIVSAIEMFPGKKITGIFQPHLFSRTRDFAEAFGQSLDLLDCVAVMDVYPARELPIKGIDAYSILDHIRGAKKTHLSNDQVLDFVGANQFDVLITMGAGNIDKFVTPIKERLEL